MSSKSTNKIYDSIDQTIGNTPMVRLNRVKKHFKLHGDIIAKLEFFNPLGSVKDRIGLSMIENAERKGLIKSNTTIIEATSGNTGIALAFICASRGYKLILTMPNSMSIERKKMLKFFDAQLILTPKEDGMKGAMSKALSIKNKIKDSIILNQFENKANPHTHFTTTAKEIWDDCNGRLDCLISGVGTGGTITGIGKFLKKKIRKLKLLQLSPRTLQL